MSFQDIIALTIKATNENAGSSAENSELYGKREAIFSAFSRIISSSTLIRVKAAPVIKNSGIIVKMCGSVTYNSIDALVTGRSAHISAIQFKMGMMRIKRLSSFDNFVDRV